MNGDLFPLKEAYAKYLRRWYEGLYPDTQAMQEYVARGIEFSVMLAPGRMVDAAEDMLASYRKNNNKPTADAGAFLPIVIFAISKDYAPVIGDWGNRQVGRMLVKLTDAPDASVYGYRQAMGEVRTQIVIFAAEQMTAGSLAAQLGLFLGEMGNRGFSAQHQWHGYTLEMPVMQENPDVQFMSVATDQKNLTILAADVTLRFQIPYLDAPAVGQPNDGSANVPPGYPVVTGVNINTLPVVTQHGSASP